MSKNRIFASIINFIIGFFVTIIFPGAVQFLSGQKLKGIIFYVIYYSFYLLGIFLASLPYKFFDMAILILSYSFGIYIIILSIVSVQPAKQMYSRRWLLFFVFGLLSLCFVIPATDRCFRYVADVYRVQTTSMFPMLQITSRYGGDSIVVNNWIYWMKEPCRSDIVRFNSPQWLWYHNDEAVGNLKRIVGLPGETVDIDPPYILINGNRLLEPSIFKTISLCQNDYNGYYKQTQFESENNRHIAITLPLTLAQDQYFVVGDNSLHSIDSRLIGTIHRKEIQGKAIRIIYPFERSKLFD
jgi:signal peptidase I